jgi:hypothetical protein
MSVEKNRSCWHAGGRVLRISLTPGFSQVKSGGVTPSRFNGLLSATKPLKRLPIAFRQAPVKFSRGQSSGVNPNQAIRGNEACIPERGLSQAAAATNAGYHPISQGNIAFVFLPFFRGCRGYSRFAPPLACLCRISVEAASRHCRAVANLCEVLRAIPSKKIHFVASIFKAMQGTWNMPKIGDSGLIQTYSSQKTMRGTLTSLASLRPIQKMLQVVATLLQKMLHLNSLTLNDVADVAPFPTSYTLCQPLRTFANLRAPMGEGTSMHNKEGKMKKSPGYQMAFSENSRNSWTFLSLGNWYLLFPFLAAGVFIFNNPVCLTSN